VCSDFPHPSSETLPPPLPLPSLCIPFFITFAFPKRRRTRCFLFSRTFPPTSIFPPHFSSRQRLVRSIEEIESSRGLCTFSLSQVPTEHTIVQVSSSLSTAPLSAWHEVLFAAHLFRSGPPLYFSSYLLFSLSIFTVFTYLLPLSTLSRRTLFFSPLRAGVIHLRDVACAFFSRPVFSPY